MYHQCRWNGSGTAVGLRDGTRTGREKAVHVVDMFISVVSVCVCVCVCVLLISFMSCVAVDERRLSLLFDKMPHPVGVTNPHTHHSNTRPFSDREKETPVKTYLL